MGAENSEIQINERQTNQTEQLLEMLTEKEKKERYSKLIIQRHTYDCCN
jgi:3-dehydroquinate dehydratase